MYSRFIAASARCSDCSYEIPLAYTHAASAQEIVRRGDVKIEVRQSKAQKIRLSLEAQLLATDGEGDVAVLRAVDVRGLEGLYEVPRPGDALLERREACFVIGEF